MDLCNSTVGIRFPWLFGSSCTGTGLRNEPLSSLYFPLATGKVCFNSCSIQCSCLCWWSDWNKYSVPSVELWTSFLQVSLHNKFNLVSRATAIVLVIYCLHSCPWSLQEERQSRIQSLVKANSLAWSRLQKQQQEVSAFSNLMITAIIVITVHPQILLSFVRIDPWLFEPVNPPSPLRLLKFGM